MLSRSTNSIYVEYEGALRPSTQVDPERLAHAASHFPSQRAKDSADWPGKAELHWSGMVLLLPIILTRK